MQSNNDKRHADDTIAITINGNHKNLIHTIAI